MSYTYDSLVTALATETNIPATQTEFLAILPTIMDYMNQRICRELDLLSTVITDASANLTTGNRYFDLPTATGTYVVVNGINVITPSGSAPAVGTRHPLTPTSRDYLDMVWPSSTGSTVPKYFAMLTQARVILGPWPDSTYTAEVIGTQRPAPPSSGNQATFILTNLPDLALAACMVSLSGYMRNFGSQADDPKMAQSWENQYQALFASANAEEFRKRFAASAWTSLNAPSPSAQPRT